MDVIQRAEPLCNEQLVLALLLTYLHCCCFCTLFFIAFQKHLGKVSEERKCHLEERELEIFWSRNRRKRLSGGLSSGGEIVLWRTLWFWSTKGWWDVSRESGISRGLHYWYVSFCSVSPRMCVGWIFLEILENCNFLGFLGFLLLGDFAKCFARSSCLQVCVLILI